METQSSELTLNEKKGVIHERGDLKNDSNTPQLEEDNEEKVFLDPLENKEMIQDFMLLESCEGLIFDILVVHDVTISLDAFQEHSRFFLVDEKNVKETYVLFI